MAGREEGVEGNTVRHHREGERGDNGEMQEDFSDLPIHFQTVESEANEQTGTPPTPIPDSVQPHNRPALMDASTQYFDSTIGLAPSYTPNPHPHQASGRGDAGFQYNPNNSAALYPPGDMAGGGHPMGGPGLFPSSYGSGDPYRDMNNGALYSSTGVGGGGFAGGGDSMPVEADSDRSQAESRGMYAPSSMTPSANSGAGSSSGYGIPTDQTTVNGMDPMLRSPNGHVDKEEHGASSEQSGLVSSGVQTGGLESGEQKAGTGETAPAKRYQCPECEVSFTRLDHLHRHLKTQRSHFQTTSNKNQYHTCPLCSKRFTRNDHMKRHIKIHARGEPVMCVECQTWFPSKMELTHHLLHAHNVLVFECNLCSKGFFEGMYLTRHLRDKHQLVDSGDGGLKQDPNSTLPVPPQGIQLPYRCGICSLNFVRESACSKHMISHTRRDRDSNPVDSLSLAASQLAEVRDTTALSQLQAHLWPNSPWSSHRQGGHNSNGLPDPSLAKKDGQGYGMALPLLPPSEVMFPGQDVKPEPGDGHHAPDAAMLPFRQRGEGNPGGDSNGQYCNAQDKLMLGHGMACGGRQPYLCGVCGLGFIRSQELKGHLRTHTGQHRFSCVECGANFASSSNLIRHQRIHTGEKPFKCSLCAAAFTHKGALVNHERIHTGERPYVCDLCEASFARVDALTRHKRTHKENRIKEEEEENVGEVFAVRA